MDYDLRAVIWFDSDCNSLVLVVDVNKNNYYNYYNPLLMTGNMLSSTTI